MARAIYYPPANRTVQWFQSRYQGVTINPDKVVWHTTETRGWPGYGGGASAPHLTYDASDHQWRQHFRADRSARALRNPAGGVETNTDDCLQVEIIAYSDEALGRAWGGLPVSELDDRALRELGDFARWANDEWGVPLTLADDWRPVAAGSLRFSYSEWRSFTGHCGHIHVPENTHWDPGRLDVWTIIDYAKGGTVSWNEDLSPGTPGNDITNLADTILPDGFGRDAADLLGYAAATLPWLRNRRFSKPGFTDEQDRSLTWFIRHAYMHSRQGRDAARMAHDQAVQNGQKLDALLDMQQGADAEAIKAHIDSRHAELVTAHDKQHATLAAMSDRIEEQGEVLDGVAELVGQHTDGTLDAAAVVDGVRRLLHQATAPVDDAEEEVAG